MEEPDAAIEALRERLSRHPPDRYPVQHATARFHLGVAFVNAGRLDEARDTLAVAVRLFHPERLPVEHGKAANALGAALRLAGRPVEAATAFEAAAAAFDASGHALEQGAAVFNLGLVEREAGEARRAVESFARARELIDPASAPGQAGAAAREHGAALLELGDVEGAAAALREARSLAERAGDLAALGAAANALGLAELGAGRLSEAVEQLRGAAGASPRSVRPAEHAMAKANLALAYERAGDEPRARLAARQALLVPGAPEPVAAQAAAVLERLGRTAGELLRVLDAEPRERWPAIVRGELMAWTDAGAEERREEAAAWIEGQLAREGVGAELAEALVGGLLELPPAGMEALVRSLVETLAGFEEERAARFRSDVARAMARFHVPQWMRLRDAFNRIAAELGQEAAWT